MRLDRISTSSLCGEEGCVGNDSSGIYISNINIPNIKGKHSITANSVSGFTFMTNYNRTLSFGNVVRACSFAGSSPWSCSVSSVTFNTKGTPRTNVPVLIPAYDDGMYFYAGSGIVGDGIGGVVSATSVQSTSSVRTFTFLVNSPYINNNGYYTLLYHYNTNGIQIYYSNLSNCFYVYITGTSSSASCYSITDNGAFLDGAYHCVTFVIDTLSLNGFRVYIDGYDITDYSRADMSFVGDISVTDYLYIGAKSNGTYYHTGSISFFREDEAAFSLNEHRLLCGIPYSIIDDENINIRSFGTKIYPVANNSACVFPSNSIHMATSSGILGIVLEDAQDNKILHSVYNPDFVWDISLATITSTDGPVGTKDAISVSINGGYMQQALSGYTASSQLFLRLWIRLLSGTLTIENTVGTGKWLIDSNYLSSDWEFVDKNSTAVTVVEDWYASSTGDVSIKIYGSDVDIYAPTLTEIDSICCIPTKTVTGSCAASSFTILHNNAYGYYSYSGTNTDSLNIQYNDAIFTINSSEYSAIEEMRIG